MCLGCLPDELTSDSGDSEKFRHVIDIESLGDMTKLHLINNASAVKFKEFLQAQYNQPKSNLELECSYCNQIFKSKG